MKPGKLLLAAGILLLINLWSCSKPKSEATDYTFENLADKPINVDIYASEDDYFNNANVVAHGTAKVRGYCTFPLSVFHLGHVYYVDIYSDDFLYNNWFWSNITLRDTFMPSRSDYDFTIKHSQYSDPSRSIWLSGLGPSTTWKAFDAYNYSGSSYTSIWSTLSSDQQSLTAIIKKNSYATLTNGIGLDTTVYFTAFYNQSANLSTITMTNPDNSVYGSFTSYFNAATRTFNGSKDTMLANIPGMGYFAMARQ